MPLPTMSMLFIFGMIVLVGCEKGGLDDEVRRLCAIDGGVKVYETVDMPAGSFLKHGAFRISSAKDAKTTDQFYFESETTFIKRGDPDLRRDHTKIIRRSDGKVLGESIYYARRGGDIPGPWHPSSFGCPSIGSQPSIENLIFLSPKEGS